MDQIPHNPSAQHFLDAYRMRWLESNDHNVQNFPESYRMLLGFVIKALGENITEEHIKRVTAILADRRMYEQLGVKFTASVKTFDNYEGPVMVEHRTFNSKTVSYTHLTLPTKRIV